MLFPQIPLLNKSSRLSFFSSASVARLDEEAADLQSLSKEPPPFTVGDCLHNAEHGIRLLCFVSHPNQLLFCGISDKSDSQRVFRILSTELEMMFITTTVFPFDGSVQPQGTSSLSVWIFQSVLPSQSFNKESEPADTECVWCGIRYSSDVVATLWGESVI